MTMVAMACMLMACDKLRGDRSDASLLTSSGGEVALADGGSLEFAITSEQYKRWDRARRGINKSVAARFGEILQPDGPTERSIDAAVTYLEGETSARRSIERAGMSVRGFVVMTVALEQEMRVASGQPAVRQPEPESLPYDFPPYDTMLIQPAPTPYPPPYPAPYPSPYPTPYPAPVDSYRVDTALPVPPRDTMSRIIIPAPRRDTIYRQTPTIFRRDTVRRDTVRIDTTRPAPLPPPVIPDTNPGLSQLPIIPPDTLRRT